MKTKKGFTLIELLAVIVILGVIMIIAIPSVTSYITNARKDSYLSDAQMFVNAAKTMLTANATLPQEAGSRVIVPISEIALDKGGEKSPYGNDWDYENSFVVVENQEHHLIQIMFGK